MARSSRKQQAAPPGITRLLNVVSRLRGPRGCPWDREQTLDSLKQYLIEESYEVLDAIDSRDRDRHKEELGDLLLQVLLQSQIRKEQGHFAFDDVAHALADKLIRRHPHVFGRNRIRVADSRQVLSNWEKIKANEKQDPDRSILDGVPRHLPALLKAQRIQSKVGRVGFDWKRARDVEAKVREEMRELRKAMARGRPDPVREEAGDLLFALVNLYRHRHIRAEEALEAANAKFVRRFKEVERRVRRQGRKLQECTLGEMDALWNVVKKEEKRRRRSRRI